MNESAAAEWSSSSRTDVGKVRQINEDACLERPDNGLWVVADGMGGHAAGDVASAMIVDTLDALEPSERLSEHVERVEESLLEVNRELRRVAQTRETHTVGSTVVALVARERFAAALWAGDSRLYRLRGDSLEQITQDHALVEELVEKGLLSREQAASHPQGNLVTRAVGASDELYVDMEIFELEPGDTFVLCSDGLDKELEPDEIASVLAQQDVARASDGLVELALSRGSRDNVTVVTVRIADHAAGRAASEEEESEDTVPGLAGRASDGPGRPSLAP